MWQQAGTILEQSQSQHTRFIGLQVRSIFWVAVRAVMAVARVDADWEWETCTNLPHPVFFSFLQKMKMKMK